MPDWRCQSQPYNGFVVVSVGEMSGNLVGDYLAEYASRVSCAPIGQSILWNHGPHSMSAVFDTRHPPRMILRKNLREEHVLSKPSGRS
jgi:hypothetical protein